MPLEEYHHYRLQKPGDPMFLLAPDEGSQPRALDAAMVGAARGGRTVALVPARAARGRAAYHEERSSWRSLVSTIDAAIQFTPAPAGGAL